MDRRPIVIAALGLLGMACLCACLAAAGFLFYNRGGGPVRTLAPLADLCTGAGVVGSAAIYQGGAGLHPAGFLVADADGDYRVDAAGFNVNWQAETLEAAELVVCIDDVRETVVERCDYALSDGATGTVSRVAVEVRFRVLAAHTGQELLRNSGISLPRDCLEQETFAGDVLTLTLRGHPADAVSPGVAPLIAPAAP